VIGACFYFFARFFVLGPEHFLGVETSLIENPLLFASAHERVATALSILWMYVQKTFWPFGLCSDYSYNQIPLVGFSNLGAWLGLGILISGFVSLFYFFKKKPIISLASAIFLVSFLPVSNLFFPIGTIAGERLFFFPSLGLALLVAFLLSKLQRKEFLIILLGFYAIFALHRQSFWLTEERLFLNAVQCAPNSVLSRSNAGATYYLKGDYGNAERELLISKAIKPIYSKGLNNLGLVYWKEGKYQEAEQMYFTSLRQKYPYPGAFQNLVLLYQSEKDQNKAIHWLRIMYPNVDDSSLRNQF
jgi:tetratricopeptide (TPR) repeat protein